MIKLFNQSIAGLSLMKVKSFIRAPFLSGRSKWIGSLVAAFVVVGVLLLNPAAADSDRHDDRRTLRLIPVFTSFHSTAANPAVLAVGDQLTFGGTLARTRSPHELIGTVGAHFVVTAPGGAEILGNGCVILPDGKISFQILLGANDVTPDRHGAINRISAITGGTGDYRNARGELNHQTRANGDEEFIFDFSN